jgi:predicted secreted protein
VNSPRLRLILDEGDQVFRLQAFRAAHPDVIVGDGGFGTWQARIPKPDGEIVTTRYTLRELLDRLDELTGRPD